MRPEQGMTSDIAQLDSIHFIERWRSNRVESSVYPVYDSSLYVIHREIAQQIAIDNTYGHPSTAVQ